MNFLTPSDFIGKYELHKGLYDTSKIEDYIIKFEPRYLMQLLGVELYNEFIGDIDWQLKEPKSPNFQIIFNPLYEDINLYQLIESDGMLEMLKGFVYFEYSKDQMMQQTTFGGVQQKSENSKVLNSLQTLIYNRYNESIKTYRAIQDWILLNTTIGTGQAIDYAYVGGNGTGYLSLPNVTLTPLSGSVLSANITNGGTSYTLANGVLTFGGSGTGFTLNIDSLFGGAINSIEIDQRGTNYTQFDVVDVSGGDDNAQVQLLGVTGLSYGTILTANIEAFGIGGVNSNQLNLAGTGYVTLNEQSLLGGSGGGASININEVDTAGEILDFEINTDGAGYIVGDLLTVSGGNADAEIEVLSVYDGQIKNIQFVNAGFDWNVGDYFLVTGGDSNCIIQLTYVGKGDLSVMKGQRKGTAYWI